MLEVHPVNARDQRAAHENGRDGGHGFHDLVELVAGLGEDDVNNACEQIPVEVDGLDKAECVVVNIVEIRHQACGDELRI